MSTRHSTPHAHTPSPGHTQSPGHTPSPSHTPTRSPEPEPQPEHRTAVQPGEPAQPAGHVPAAGETPGDAGGDAGGDPRVGWFKGFAQSTGDTIKQKGGEAVGGFVVDKAKEALFGQPADGSGEGAGGDGSGGPGGEGAGSTRLDSVGGGEVGAAGAAVGGGIGGVGGVVGVGTGLVAGRMPSSMGGPGGPNGTGLGGTTTGMSAGSSAYGWAQTPSQDQMAPLPVASHPSRGGLGGALDEAVQYALDKTGLMDMLDKVTGNLDELNAAAQEWQAQAKAVRNLAEALRAGALPLAEQWEGSASDAFGAHMGEVVDALDNTADGMYQTAQIISSAAQECALAEGMVVEIISEAIEALIASLAAEAVIAVLTAGIGLIADALITEGEIVVFVARVAKVSEKLAETLEKLLMKLKELGAAVKAVRSIGDAKKVITALKEVKTAAQGVRDFEQGGDGLGKLAKDAWKDKSLAGVGDGLKDFAVRKGVGYVDDKLTGMAQDEFNSALGIGSDDPVQTGDLSGKGLAGAAGRSAWGAAKAGLTSDTNKSAVEGELAHDLGLESDPAPYRVDASRIEQAFG